MLCASGQNMRTLKPFLSLALLVLVATPCLAQTAPASTSGKRPMTFEDMMAMKRLGSTAVSSDGKWLAYAATTVDLNQNSKTTEWFLQQISGGAPKPISVTQPNDSGVQFSPDGKQILFLSAHDGNQQVWTADFDTATGATGHAKRITNIATETSTAIWSPDSKSILLTSAVYPDCPAITESDFNTGNQCNADKDKILADSKVKAQIFTHLLYRHWNHFTGDRRSHLFLLTVDTAALRDLTPNDSHDVPPFSLSDSSCGCAFSPDSRELAFTENPDPEPAISTSAQIYTLDLTNPAAKPVKISTSAGGNFNPAYSPDGKYLAWRSQARAGYESDKFRLMLYDRSTKQGKDLLPTFDNWVDEFVWNSDSRGLHFVSGNHGEAGVYATGITGASATHFDERGEFSGLALVPKNPGQKRYGFGDMFVATKMKVDQPSEVVTFMGGDILKSADGESLAISSSLQALVYPITHLNDALLAQLDLPAMESFWFTAADGTKLQGFLIKPPSFDPAKKYPLKFLIHGGPQGAWGDAWSYRWNPELFAANGYVVVMINPRGSTGYGQAVVDGVNGDWGGKPYTDLMTGLDYAEQHYSFIDKNRECALGASYGGYMANWILGHTTRFKCIVAHDGMYNAESAFGSTEEDWFNQWEFKGNPWDYYGKPDSENPFRKWSPSLYAKNFKTPTLVIHGQLDYRLDVSEGYQLFDTLQLLKVPSKMLYFPDEGHWVLKPQNSQLWYKTVNDWVDQWTK